MEIVIEPTFQQITWIVKNFLELPQDRTCFDSPEFFFSGDRYCLRMHTEVISPDGDVVQLTVKRLSVTFPEREVVCRIGIRSRETNGDEYYDAETFSLGQNGYSVERYWNEGERDEYVPDGSLTVVCSMWLRRTRRSAQREEEQQGFPGHKASFSFQWSSPTMELITESPCTHVQLTVPNFFALPREAVNSLTCPEFRFAGDAYSLRFRPNGDTGDTDLQLVRRTSNVTENAVYYRVGYRWSENHTCPNDPTLLVGSTGWCASRAELEEYGYKYEGLHTLHLVLFLHLRDIQSTAQKRTGLTDLEKLQSDYRQLLQQETASDACFVVRGKEFPVHRVVLRARSPVFEAMFNHDTTEKESGRVVLGDLDPDCFGDFLEYLYTGNVQAGLSDDNAFGLYVAADKYDVSTLRSKCVEHMRRTLSLDSFCDVVTLALRHHEEDLLQQAIKFLKVNLKLVIITAKWQQFNIDNGATANELIVKALVPGTR